MNNPISGAIICIGVFNSSSYHGCMMLLGAAASTLTAIAVGSDKVLATYMLHATCYILIRTC